MSDFEGAKTQFTQMLPVIGEKQTELKELKKVHNVHKKTIYNYMRESGIEEMEVGGYLFSIKTKERLTIKQSDIEELLDAQTLAPFYESKESFGVKRQKVSH
jgi:hypothetical protein